MISSPLHLVSDGNFHRWEAASQGSLVAELEQDVDFHSLSSGLCTPSCSFFHLLQMLFMLTVSLSEKLFLSGMPQLERSEFLVVDVKCSTCLCFHVPSTSAHLDRSSLEHRRSEMDYFFLFVSCHSIVRRNYMVETQCFFEPTKPTHRAFSLVSMSSS